MKDMTCLGDGLIFEVDSKVTGINLNELIVGGTGSGKSYSTAYPRLLHTFDSSVVVPIAKRALKDKFEAVFRRRGYEVITLDFANPGNSTCGYDPMDYIKTDEDVIKLARSIVDVEAPTGEIKRVDPYWDDSATSVLAAEIQLIRMNAREKKERPRFADVITLHRCLNNVSASSDTTCTNLDILFKEAESLYPGNQASEMWKTLTSAPRKTGSCILSSLNTMLDKIFTESCLQMMSLEKKVDLGEIGERKTALFIMSSPMNTSLLNLINILYGDLFRSLFEKAEGNPTGELNVPVHIICDDFACSGKIHEFENYISIFRAARISVTMLLQSESQLEGMYGKTAATTIINNCDTYVYMGGMDIETCKHISMRINKPVDKVLSLPLEQVMVFRRGAQPMITRRYQILDDPLWRETDTVIPTVTESEMETEKGV